MYFLFLDFTRCCIDQPDLDAKCSWYVASLSLHSSTEYLGSSRR